MLKIYQIFQVQLWCDQEELICSHFKRNEFSTLASSLFCLSTWIPKLENTNLHDPLSFWTGDKIYRFNPTVKFWYYVCRTLLPALLAWYRYSWTSVAYSCLCLYLYYDAWSPWMSRPTYFIFSHFQPDWILSYSQQLRLKILVNSSIHKVNIKKDLFYSLETDILIWLHFRTRGGNRRSSTKHHSIQNRDFYFWIM